jgi:hypothetical protein
VFESRLLREIFVPIGKEVNGEHFIKGSFETGICAQVT